MVLLLMHQSMHRYQHRQDFPYKSIILQKKTCIQISGACMDLTKTALSLEWQKNKYERHPSSDEIRINEHLDEKNNVFEIDILFERVLPMPSCILLSNDQDLKAQNVTKQHSIGMFYNVSIQLKLNNSLDDCPNNITLKCSIGGYNISHTVKDRSFCSDIPNVHSDQKYDAKVFIIIPLLTVFLSLVVFGSLKFKHVYLSNKGQQQDEELESIAILGTCEPGERQEVIPSLETHERGERLESIETDEQGPLLESKASTETHGQMNKSSNARSWSASHSPVTQKEKGERQESISLLAAHGRGERQQSISLLETHERGERLESKETDEQDERLDSTALLETCEPGDRLKSIETDEQDDTHAQALCIETHVQVHVPNNEKKDQSGTDNFTPMQKDRHVRKCLKLKKKKKKEKSNLVHLQENETEYQYRTDDTHAQALCIETHAQVHVPKNERKAQSRTDNFTPMQKDRHVRECQKLKTKEKQKSNLVEEKKIPPLKEKLGKVE